jgi:hypothetical protein
VMHVGRPRPVTRLAAMLGRTPIALLAGVFVIALGGCGGSSNGTIPSSDSEKLLGMLAQLQSYVSTGDCTLAEGTAADVTAAVKALPDGVDPDVETALTKAADNLEALTKDPTKCTDTGASGAEGVTTTDSTSTTIPTSTSTSTTTTETSTPEQTGETPPTGTPPGQGPTTPPGNGEGNQGNGNGNGGPESGGVGAGGKR